MARFDGMAFVVTGGTTGIGLATALGLLAGGGRVLATGSRPEGIAQAAAAHPEITFIRNDAADLGAADVLAAEARERFGVLDGVFLNAGRGGGAPLGQITPQLYQALFDLNVRGVLFGVQALAPLVRDGGSILITTSAAKDRGTPGGSVYAASKGALRSMCRSLASELAPRSIRVNTLSPGATDTPFFARVGRSPEVLEKMLSRVIAKTPLKRMGTPVEVAAAALFLLSNESTFVTGSDYAVDGGVAQI